VALNALRRTESVMFDTVPVPAITRIDAIDRVIHERGALSPGTVGDVERPWYMHPHQEDHLVVLHGTRYIDLYTQAHGRIEHFVQSPDMIKRNGELVHDGPAMLSWPVEVFHRIVSCEREGSASLNFAAHYEGFDIRTNFSIYDLDTDTGEYRVIREGFRDQPEST
jgi:hypothetical protein